MMSALYSRIALKRLVAVCALGLLVLDAFGQQIHDLTPDDQSPRPAILDASDSHLFFLNLDSGTLPSIFAVDAVSGAQRLISPLEFGSGEHAAAVGDGILLFDKSEYALTFVGVTGEVMTIPAPAGEKIEALYDSGSGALVQTVRLADGEFRLYWVAPQTALLERIRFGSEDVSVNPSATDQIMIRNDRFMLLSDAGDGQHELWYWRAGTLSATVVGDGFNSTGRFVATSDGRFAFESWTHDVWVSDGTIEGTYAISRPPDIRERMIPLAFLGDRVVISACSDAEGCEMWSADGPDSGLVLLADVNPGPADGMRMLKDAWEANGRVFYRARPRPNEYRLWSTDGTPEGTYQLADSPTNPLGFEDERHNIFSWLGAPLSTEFGFIFPATTGEHGAELWTTGPDGSSARLLADVYPGSYSALPHDLTRVGNDVYAVATVGSTGEQLIRISLETGSVDIVSETATTHLVTSNPDRLFSVGEWIVGEVRGLDPFRHAFAYSSSTGELTLLIRPDGVPIKDWHRSFGVADSRFALLGEELHLIDVVDREVRVPRVAGIAWQACDYGRYLYSFRAYYHDGSYYLCAYRRLENTEVDGGLVQLDPRTGTIEKIRPDVFSGTGVLPLDLSDDRLTISKDGDIVVYSPGDGSITTFEATGPDTGNDASIRAAFVHDRTLYFTDPSDKSLRALDLESGNSSIVLENLDVSGSGHSRVWTVRSGKLFTTVPGDTDSSAELVSFDLENRTVESIGAIPRVDVKTTDSGLIYIDRPEPGEYLFELHLVTWDDALDRLVHAQAGSSEPPELLFEHDGRIVFSTYTPSTGSEPWVYDVRSDQAALLADIYPGPASSSPGAGRLETPPVAGGAVWIAAYVPDGQRELVSIDLSSISISTENPVELPGDITVGSIWPNPVTGTATLDIDAPVPQHVSVEAFDVLGRHIGRVYSGLAGGESGGGVEIDAAKWAAGMYLLRVEGETFSITRALIRAR